MKTNWKLIFLAEDDGSGGAGGGSAGGGQTLLSGAGDGSPGAGAGSAGDGKTPDASWIGADGAFVDGWADKLPADLKDAIPTASRYKSVPEMVKALHHANQALGKRGVTVPTDKSSPEEIAAFRSALGVPESPDGYKLKPDQLPEGVAWSDDLAKPFAEIAHKHNIPPAAMQELVNLHMSQQATATQAAAAMLDQRIDEGMQALRDAWKGETDKNLAFVSRVAKTLGLDPTSPGLTDPAVVIALQRAGAMMSEDKLIRSDAAATLMPGKVRANEIMTNPADALYADYHGKNGKERQSAAAKMVQDLLANG